MVTSSMDDDFQCIVPFRNSSAYIDGTIISGKQKLQVTNNTQGAAMVSDEIKFADGTDYLVVVADALAGGNDAVGVRVNVFGSTAGAQLSIAWQLPQYAILTAGEVLFSITGEHMRCAHTYDLSARALSSSNVVVSHHGFLNLSKHARSLHF